MDQILDIHILNDLSEVVLIHLIFVNDYLICSVLESENEMRLRLALSVPRRWSQARDIASRTHFDAFQVDDSSLADLLGVLTVICSVRNSYDRLSSLEMRHFAQL